MGKRKYFPTFYLFLLFLASCQGTQSMFEGAGAESIAIAKLWWILLFVSLFAFVAVVLALVIGMYRKVSDVNHHMDKLLGRSIAWATGVTVVILIATLIATYEFSKPQVPRKDPDIIIQMTGRMWWWEIKYFTKEGEFLFETANEFAIPVQKTVLFKLRSEDVIHSFWIPSLAGKMDMIPGHENELWLRAEKLGEYRGQCAEFCGIQHAKMALVATAMTENEFKAWVNDQKKPAQIVKDELAQRGKEVYQTYGCVECHSVRSDLKAVKVGPDLTHVASRKTLAAVSIPNNKGHLAAWIANPQGIKPGNFMPATALSPEDFKALLHYLRSLK